MDCQARTLVPVQLFVDFFGNQAVCQGVLLQRLKHKINGAHYLDDFRRWSEHVHTMKARQRQQDAPGTKPGLKTENHVEAFLAGGYFDAENEASGQLQCVGSAALAAVACGELDLNALAIIELAARGQDERAKWVGFEKAREIAVAKLAKKGATK